MPRRHAIALAAAGAACLALAGSASADSISYVKGGDVWLATPDGARHFQVTSTGLYSYASQADDGTFIALAGERLHRLDRYGKVLADFATPVSDGPPPPNPPAWGDTQTNYFNGPFEPQISPDGSKVSYTYYWQHYTYDYVYDYWRNKLDSGTAISHGDRLTSWDEFGGPLTGWVGGSWMDGDTLMRTNAGVPLAEDIVFNDIAPGGGGEIRRWFRNYRGYDRADPEMNRQGTALALSGDGPADEGGRHMGIYRVTGDFQAEPERCFSVFDDSGQMPRGASWSPDGLRLAFQDTGGVKVFTVGDLSGGCHTPADAFTTIAADGSAPDWGPADVPTSRPASAQGPGAAGGPASRAGGGAAARGGALKVSAASPRVRLGAALRSGVRVTVAAPGAGRVAATARLGRTVVARGTARTTAARRVAVRMAVTPAGRRTLRSARTARLKVAVTFTPVRGAAVRGTAKLTVAR